MQSAPMMASFVMWYLAACGTAGERGSLAVKGHTHDGVGDRDEQNW